MYLLLQKVPFDDGHMRSLLIRLDLQTVPVCFAFAITVFHHMADGLTMAFYIPPMSFFPPLNGWAFACAGAQERSKLLKLLGSAPPLHLLSASLGRLERPKLPAVPTRRHVLCMEELWRALI